MKNWENLENQVREKIFEDILCKNSVDREILDEVFLQIFRELKQIDKESQKWDNKSVIKTLLASTRSVFGNRAVVIQAT